MYRKETRTHFCGKQPSCAINRKMEGQELLLLIDSLKDEEQELVLLKYYYQLSYAEIALILELSVENVRKNCIAHVKIKKNWRNRSGFKKYS